MKGKNLLLITVLALALMLTGTNKLTLKAEESYVAVESIVGYYRAIKMTNEGEDMTEELEQLNEMGGGIFMIIHEDNTGEINLLGEITRIEIDGDQLLVLNEDGGISEQMTFEFEDGNITLKQGIEQMEFTRMSIDEIEAFKNGETGKSIDELIDDAFDEGEKTIDDGVKLEEFQEEEETIKFDDSYLPDLSASSHEDAGYYEIMEYKDGEDTYTAQQLSDEGIMFDIMLCPDGTGFAHFLGTYYDLSWEDGTMYVVTDDGQEKMIYVAEEYEGKHVITISGTKIAMVFENVSEPDPTYQWQGNSGLSN